MKIPDATNPNAILGLLKQMAAMVEDGRFVPPQHLAMTLRQSHDTIRALMCRTGMQAKALEAAELEVALLRTVCYGTQKGGAA